VAEAQVSDRIINIPNTVTFIRLLGIPVFWWVLLGREDIGLAAAFFFVIGLTDWIDGYLARRLDQITKLGTALDPIADRLLIASAIIGGLIAGVIPWLFAIPLITRELLMGVVTLNMLRKGAGTLEVRYLGKIATFVLFGAIPSFYLSAADIGKVFFEPFALVSGVVGLVLYWTVALQYFGDARRRIMELESSPGH